MRLGICEEDLEDGFDEEIKNVRALVKTITPALKGGGKESAKKLVVFVGTRRAMTMAIHQQDTALRQTALEQLLKGN
jgi:hypothetical protein